MKLKLPLRFLALLGVASVTRVEAQWYAPATSYHDPVQRVFPVELARVLAWRENQSGAKIAEIVYEVNTTADGATRWKLRWLAADGSAWRETEVNYAADVLVRGPEFYRTVFRQMTAVPWVQAAASTEEETAAAFWSGLDDMGPSRLATVRTALKRERSAPARLAGQLFAAAVPGLGGLLTLDSTLAARGAAWLAVSELSLPAPETAADRRWAVALWLGRRESGAAKLWAPGAGTTGSNPHAVGAETGGVARGWWDVVLRQPTVREVCLRAADFDEPTWAMPLLAYAAQLKNRPYLLPSAARILFDERQLLPVHDYAAWISAAASIEGGHLTNGRWMQEGRRDWLETLRALPPEQRSGAGVAAALEKAWQNRDEAPAGNTDASLTGFAAATDLIRLCFRDSLGRLEPVDVVTRQDLMEFGWELSGTQMAARHRFIAARFGDMEAGAEMQKEILGAVPELGPFFQTQTWKDDLPGIENYDRLQRVEMGWTALLFSKTPTLDTRNRAERARRFAARNWLMSEQLGWQIWMLASSRQYPAVVTMLRRAHEEGGLMTDQRGLAFLHNAYYAKLLEPMAEGKELKQTLASRLPPGDSMWLVVRREERRALPPLARARELERLYWSDPTDDGYSETFNAYLEANAIVSAKRFYDQVVPLIDDQVRFSNTMGPRRLTLALLENDPATAERILREISTGSLSDLVANIMVATVQGDRAAVERIARDVYERYQGAGSREMSQTLIDFMPLWSALEKPGHADRGKALDYFATYEKWPTFQWMLAKKLGLSRDETIRFLGGDGAKGERWLMINYLRGDRTAFESAFNEFGPGRAHPWQNMAFVVAQSLRADLLQTPPVADVPPTGVTEPQTLLMALRTVHEARLLSGVAERIAALTTADTLWAHIEALPQQSPPGSRAELQRRLREMGEALHAFRQRYPQDERVWQARLNEASLAPVLAWQAGTAPDQTALRRALGEIAGAATAPRKVRAQAAVILCQIEAGQLRGAPTAEARRELAGRIETWQADLAGEPIMDTLDLLAVEVLGPIDREAADRALERAARSSQPAVAARAAVLRRQRDVFTKPLEFKFTAVDGREVDLTALRGRVVLVDFWATWCPPCVAEMPKLVELYTGYQSRGFEIVGISLDQSRKTLTDYIERHGLKWPHYFDGNGWGNSLSSGWGIESIPTKWLVDKAGHVQAVAAETDLEAEIKRLLSQ